MTPSYVEGGSLAALVDAEADANREMLTYLESRNLYCHSDLGQALVDAATTACGDSTAYSPSFATCRYVALVTNRRVFALAHDMAFICIRLTDALLATACESGAQTASEIGAAWARIQLFRADYPDPDLRFWLLRAYAAARGDTTG
jgi:hypothetical protein